jgi:hypothetical protein
LLGGLAWSEKTDEITEIDIEIDFHGQMRKELPASY